MLLTLPPCFTEDKWVIQVLIKKEMERKVS